MRSAINSRRTSPRSGRLLGGIALFVFLGAFFVVPLWAALALCTMPCCQHDSGNGLDATLSPDMSGCETECSIAAVDAVRSDAPAIVPSHDSERGVPLPPTVVVDVRTTQPSSVVVLSTSESVVHGRDAAIHILNSTFRI